MQLTLRKLPPKIKRLGSVRWGDVTGSSECANERDEERKAPCGIITAGSVRGSARSFSSPYKGFVAANAFSCSLNEKTASDNSRERDARTPFFVGKV